MGPLLFLVYINYICDVVDTNVRLFADDTTLYIFVDNSVHSAELLNQDLSKLNAWADKWLIKFSQPTTKAMTISLKRSNTHSPIYFDGAILEEVSNHKHLGLTLQNDLKWNIHIYR